MDAFGAAVEADDMPQARRFFNQSLCSWRSWSRLPMASRLVRMSNVVTIFTSASYSVRVSQITFSSATRSVFSQSKLAAAAG